MTDDVNLTQNIHEAWKNLFSRNIVLNNNEPNDLKTHKWTYNFLRDVQYDNGGRKGAY